MPSLGAAQWGDPIVPPLYILMPHGQTPCKVDFEDFIVFAQAFNSTPEAPNWNVHADTNLDGVVSFPDFIAFAQGFGLTSVSGVCSPYTVSGDIVSQEDPIANVWMDILEKQTSLYNSPGITKTNSMGQFTTTTLETGHYTLVPKKLGYQFMPDTLRATIDNGSVILPPIEGVMQFGLVHVKVVQDSLPFADVTVQLIRSGDTQNLGGTGTTDPSGVSVVRVSVFGGQSDMTGLYDVKVTNQTTVLGDWKNVSVQSEDRRQLLLEVGKEPIYIPERKYHFNLRGQYQAVTPSSEFVTAQFNDGVADSAKQKLLQEIGLIAGDFGFGDEYLLTEAKDDFAVLDALHRLRKSGLVRSVNPGFKYEQGTLTATDEIKIFFREGISLAQVGDFANEIGAIVDRSVDNNSYIMRVNDLLSRDVFEIEAQYSKHILVEQIEIVAYHTIVIVN